MKYQTNPILASAILFGGASFFAHTSSAQQGWEGSASLEVQNRYVAEGISEDNDADGFFFGEIAFEKADFTLGAAYVQAISGSIYNEVNLFAEYAFDLGEFVPFVGVQWNTFPAEGDDNEGEAFVGFDWEAWEDLTVYGEFFYEFYDVRGGFFTFGAEYELAEVVEGIVFTPYAEIGVDFGFVSESRRLIENNFQIGLVASHELENGVELFAGLNHSFALNNLDREDEGDVTWGGVGVAFGF
ncbi:MAG: hypothetical protein LAT55_02105 [Opitutales bacterium]|nr:hypothetical protein [Opitutales bacterium]